MSLAEKIYNRLANEFVFARTEYGGELYDSGDPKEEIIRRIREEITDVLMPLDKPDST